MKIEFKKRWDVVTGPNSEPGTVSDPQDCFEEGANTAARWE